VSALDRAMAKEDEMFVLDEDEERKL
jgi:hypothetical protein